VLNVVSSPGSGKTTFIRETAAKLGKKLRVGVIVGDLATDAKNATLLAWLHADEPDANHVAAAS